VFLTAECLLKPLCNTYEDKGAAYYYENNIIIKESDNKLGRKLISFFRCSAYSLADNKWNDYRDFIKKLIANLRNKSILSRKGTR
jgi:hypothetical protein